MALGDISKAPDRTEYSPVTQNTSEESINGNGFVESDVALISRNKKPTQFSNLQKYGTLLVLFAINMLNYMDRFTIVGVLAAVKSEFQIDNKRAGLLQTAFMISYMCLSPLVGYMGDRYNRKVIILLGTLFWVFAVFFSSFISGPQNFWWFVATRCLVGIGEASYSCIAPTIITDMFEPERRNNAVSFFVVAIPVGSGVGFIAGSQMVNLAKKMGWGGWEWSLRATPPLGLLCVLLLWIIMPRNIPRGSSDGVMNEKDTGYAEDLKYLMRNRSWCRITAGFIGVSFSIGALSYWFPQFIASAYVLRGDIPPCVTSDCEYSDIMFKFGLITTISGLGGVAIGLFSSNKLKSIPDRPKTGDAEICGIGQFVLGFFTFVALISCLKSKDLTWFCGFTALIGGCVNWALMVNMTMETCVPKRRATANALQMFLGHALGDAISPALIGFMADGLTEAQGFTADNEPFLLGYKALQYSMLMCPLMSLFGGAMFLWTGLSMVKDREDVERYIRAGGDESALMSGETSRTSSSNDSHNSASIIRRR